MLGLMGRASEPNSLKRATSRCGSDPVAQREHDANGIVVRARVVLNKTERVRAR